MLEYIKTKNDIYQTGIEVVWHCSTINPTLVIYIYIFHKIQVLEFSPRLGDDLQAPISHTSRVNRRRIRFQLRSPLRRTWTFEYSIYGVDRLVVSALLCFATAIFMGFAT